MALIKCPECSQVISNKAASCPQCGFPITDSSLATLPDIVECYKCKKSYPFNDEICPYCGFFNSEKSKLIQPVECLEKRGRPASIMRIPKSRSIAVLLALLLGGIGAHKFYLNKPRTGVLYLLFCWSFIPAIIGLFEGLNYLLMSDNTFENRYR